MRCPHAIDQLVDASRHHRLPLDPGFPFAIKAFSYESFVPGERLATRLDKLGYWGDYSVEVFNDDYQQMPMERVCARAFRAAEWLGEDALRRSAPLPNRMRLRS